MIGIVKQIYIVVSTQITIFVISSYFSKNLIKFFQKVANVIIRRTINSTNYNIFPIGNVNFNSCSWAATPLASITVFLISFAFCLKLSSFPFNSFSSLSISFLLSSISVAASQLLTSISSSRDSCKNE